MRNREPGTLYAPGKARPVPASIRLLAGAAALMAAACNDPIAGADPKPVPSQVKVAARGSSEGRVDISTLAQLRAMTLTGNYRLIKDITMSSGDPGFAPIGSPISPFRGTFDGGGYTLVNFRTRNNTSTASIYRGLFGGATDAIIRKVRMTNVDVVGEGYTGAIVGYMNNSSLTDSYVTGTVSGLSDTRYPGWAVGMMVGYAGTGSEILRCHASGTVKGVVMTLGGLVGEVHAYGFRNLDYDPRVNIWEVYTNVNVNATPPDASYPNEDVAAGGVVGLATGVNIRDVYAVGNVKGRGSPGGIAGRIVNDDQYSDASEFHQGVYIGDVASTSGGPRAGAIGSRSGLFMSGSRCAVYYNKTVDGGVPYPINDGESCNVGMTTTKLQAPHPSPGRYYDPYIIGMLVTQDSIDAGVYEQCKLASGSDGDWGFGTCGEPVVWKTNAGNQYNTLVNIPEPSKQVLQ